MGKSFGSKTWLVPDCYWPEITTEGHYVSHEAICLLNTGDTDAHVHITLYFEAQAPMDDFYVVCGAMRTNHVRLDKLLSQTGKAVPLGIAYAALVESDVPVVAQYSRLDTTQSNMTLMTTVAHAID